MKTSYIKGLVIFLLLLALVDCQKNTKPIVVGEEVEVTTETIGIEGGTITVSKPGDPLDGLTIEVPAGTYSETKNYEISYRPIISHKFGNDFNPLTPLITIDNGHEFSSEVVTIKIPVKIPDPENDFAMAFYYDENTGELEGMPLIAQEPNSITVATCHFSNFAVVYAKVQELKGLALDTDFKHGIDDWQFKNYGSYVADSGQCSGQSVAALYYYIVKKKREGKPYLYGLYDNNGNSEHKTPTLQWDDELAYKLCSVIQREKSFDTELKKKSYKLQLIKGDIYTYLCFAYTLKKTGKPQYVSVNRWENENTPDKKHYGHALIVYKKSGRTMLNGREVDIFYVSDPNFPYKPGNPTEENKIVFDFETLKFEPYQSGERADGVGKRYPKIYYFGVSSFINISLIKDLWAKVEDKTIGQDIFPAYTLTVNSSGSETELIDGYKVQSDALDIKLCIDGYLGYIPVYPQLTIYNSEGNEINTYYAEDIADVCLSAHVENLKEGANLLGFHIKGDTENKNRGYIGFKWINLIYEKPVTPSVDLSGFNQCTFRFSVVKGRGVDSDGGEYDKYINVDMYPTGTFSGNTFNGTEDRECGEKCKQTGTFRATVDPCADDPTQLCVTSFKAEGLLDMSAQDWTWSIQNNANKPIYEDVKETDRIGFWGFGSSVCDYFDPATLKYREQYSSSYVDVLSPYSCDEDSEFEITFNKQ